MTGTSGTLTTSNANDLLFGFFHSDDNVTNAAGSGFTGRTLSGMVAIPLAEDRERHLCQFVFRNDGLLWQR